MRIPALIGKDIKQILGDWKAAVFLVIMPVLFTAFFGLVIGSGAEEDPRIPLRIEPRPRPAAGSGAGVPTVGTRGKTVDAAPAMTSEEAAGLLARSFDDSELFSLVGPGTEASETEQAAVLELPEDFSAALRRGEMPPLTLRPAPDRVFSHISESLLESHLERFASALRIASATTDELASAAPLSRERRDELFSRSLDGAFLRLQEDRIPLQTVAVKAADAGGTETVEIGGFEQSSPGMIVQFAVFGLITSAMVLLFERRSGALQRLLTTPLTRGRVVLGHTLAMFLIVLGQEFILVILGRFLFGVDYFSRFLGIFIMMICLAAWTSSLGLFIGTVARREEQVVTISLIFMFAFSALGGAWFPLSVAGEGFSTVGHLLPSAWAMDGFQNILLRGLGLESVLLPAAINLAYAALFLGLAVWRFRRI
jgi:ABC-2 type transport system permease protein